MKWEAGIRSSTKESTTRMAAQQLIPTTPV
jgi:hypothetical protein